jgi:hypothetical protein
MNLDKIEQFIKVVGFPAAMAGILLWLLVIKMAELQLSVAELGSKLDLINATIARIQK